MPPLDPDSPNKKLVAQVMRYYEDSAQRLKDLVTNPTGKTDKAKEFTQARASQLLSQVQAEIDRLKKQTSSWTGTALGDAVAKGRKTAYQQARDAGILPAGQPQGSFATMNHRQIEILGQETIGDFHKAADSMGHTAKILIHRMAATGVTNEQVNEILAGRHIIQGQPVQAARELQGLLEKVHGKSVTIQGKNSPINFKCSYYAGMVANTKSRQVSTMARHIEFREMGIYAVKIVGRISKNFCTAFVGHVYSIDPREKRFPSIDTLPGNGIRPPFHPNCSKSTTAYIESLASPASQKHAAPDPQSEAVAAASTPTEAQKIYRETHGAGAATQRHRDIINDINARAKAAGYKPPPSGLLPRDEGDFIIDPTAARTFKTFRVEAEPDIDMLDAETQKWAAKGIEKAVSIGLIPPTRITGGIFPSKAAAVANYDWKSGTVTINAAYESLKTIEQKAVELGDAGTWSTKDPHHPVLHEIVHHDHLARLGQEAFDQAIGNNKLTKEQKAIIRQEVSYYAAKSRTNFIAEMTLACKLTTKTFSKAVLQWYFDYGGSR